MRALKLFLSAAVLLSLSFKSFAPVSGITSAERETAINYLTETKEALLKSVDDLSESQLNFKITSESWTIKQCVEHIALTETDLWEMIQDKLTAKG